MTGKKLLQQHEEGELKMRDFLMVPADIMNNTSLSSNAKVVAVFLSSYANYPASMPPLDLVDETGMSKEEVEKTIDELIIKEILHVNDDGSFWI